MSVRVEFVGDKALARKIEALSRNVSGSKRTAALMAGGLVIEAEWKRIVPYETGTYRRSIHTEPEGIDVIVGTNIDDPPYPRFLEFGTSRMSPHPSARPAFDASKEAAVQEVADALKALVEDV